MTTAEAMAHAVEWLGYAESDLVSAQSLRRYGEPSPRHAGWLAGQAAEKALKAAVSADGIDPPETHDLEQLRRGLRDGWPAVTQLPNLDQLTAWYPLAVYPGEWAIVTDPGATEMVELGGLVVDAVRADLALHARAPAQPDGVGHGLPVHDHVRPRWGVYQLRVDGLVTKPLLLTADDLRAMEQAPFDADFACLEGWVAPDQHWSGVPLRDVLELAIPSTDARWVAAAAGDFSWPMPIEDAGRALLALDLNGEPLTEAHGAPVRLVVAGGDCFTSIKWIEHIEVRAEPAANTAETTARRRLGLDMPD